MRDGYFFTQFFTKILHFYDQFTDLRKLKEIMNLDKLVSGMGLF